MLTSSGLVAFSIVSLLPVELVLNVGSGAGFAMVFSLLLSAIIWNLGTWYLGLPASSSHTLVGSIMGVGLANSLVTPGHVFGEGVNWAKAGDVFASLIVSPVVGFVGAALLLLLCKSLIKREDLYRPPEKDQPPPTWIRGLLMLTCTGVSFFHGSNDGQKGMGLLVLILVGVLPGTYALNPATKQQDIQKIVSSAQAAQGKLDARKHGDNEGPGSRGRSLRFPQDQRGRQRPVRSMLWPARTTTSSPAAGPQRYSDLTVDQRRHFRSDIYLMSESINKLIKSKKSPIPRSVKTLSTLQFSARQRNEIYPSLGEVRGCDRPRVGHNDRLEAYRGDGGREDREGAFDLCPRRLGRNCRDGYHRSGGPVWVTSQYNPRAIVRHCRYDGRESVGTPDGYASQPSSGMGAHACPFACLLGASLFSFSFYIIFHVIGIH